MRMRRNVMSAALLALAITAGTAPAQQPAPIERQMTPEQFRAAGLDRLTPEQLANLNAWLNRTLVTETAKAAETAKKRVEDENRGFFNFGSTEPVVSRLSGEFRGFQRGRVYVLDNGQHWRQVDDASLPGVRKATPGVRISPAVIGNAWYLAIEGYNARAKVVREK